MRTTISLDDHLAQAVRREARARSMSMSAFIADILADAVQRKTSTDAPPVKLSTVSRVRLRPGIDLDRPRALEIQDDEKEFLKGSSGGT